MGRCGWITSFSKELPVLGATAFLGRSAREPTCTDRNRPRCLVLRTARLSQFSRAADAWKRPTAASGMRGPERSVLRELRRLRTREP